MKKINIICVSILAILMICTINTFAQKPPEKAKPAQIRINAKGGIYDQAGTKLGYITKNDIVKNNKGEKLYFIDNNGNVIDSKGTKLGMAKKNGNYYNNQGQVVLQLKNINETTCELLDPEGHNMGTTHKNYKLHACAAHCFFLQQKKDKESPHHM
ncbi:MAG: 5-fold beta-flower protein [Mucilaginibacter sp.]|uniref:5-fold beta-flower protein n=1 Tax=Mucilaginibacter sp. TaxID=1882438 RepID=UPI0032663B61